MKLSRQFTVFGSAIFCVVIFSLYLMLDRGHLDYPKGQRREGSFPQVSTGGAELREGRHGGRGVVTRCSSPSPSRGGPAPGRASPALPRWDGGDRDPGAASSRARRVNKVPGGVPWRDRAQGKWPGPHTRTPACQAGLGHLLAGERARREALPGWRGAVLPLSGSPSAQTVRRPRVPARIPSPKGTWRTPSGRCFTPLLRHKQKFISRCSPLRWEAVGLIFVSSFFSYYIGLVWSRRGSLVGKRVLYSSRKLWGAQPCAQWSNCQTSWENGPSSGFY